MSTVLLEFIEPYRESADTPEATKSLVALGALAWNLSLLPEHERDSFLAQALTKGTGGSSLVGRLATRIGAGVVGESRETADFKRIVHELVERKLRYYEENRRFILSYELSQTEGHIHLVVLSTQ